MYAQFVCLHKGCPAPAKRIQYKVAGFEKNLMLEVVSVRIKEILNQLGNKLSFIGMKPMDVLCGFSFFVVIK